MSHQQRSDHAPTRGGMPVLGLGTWQNDDPAQCTATVAEALKLGYRHLDTAQAYDNESAVGDGIERADVSREDVFLATKVWIDRLDPEQVVASTETSLGRLGTDHVDLLYVHWPAGDYDPQETLEAFAELKNTGKIDRIGVSNFTPDQIERARDVLGEYPFAIQVEMHPLLPQTELREYATGRDVELVAYSPLARGEVFDVDEIAEIASKHGVSEAQVSLAWLREKDVTAIPKATGTAHLEDNWMSLSLTLDDEDMATIDGIDRTDRRVHPSFAPDSW